MIAPRTSNGVTSLEFFFCNCKIESWMARWKSRLGCVSKSSPVLSALGVSAIRASISDRNWSTSTDLAARSSKTSGSASKCSTKWSTVINSWRASLAVTKHRCKTISKSREIMWSESQRYCAAAFIGILINGATCMLAGMITLLPPFLANSPSTPFNSC